MCILYFYLVAFHSFRVLLHMFYVIFIRNHFGSMGLKTKKVKANLVINQARRSPDTWTANVVHVVLW
jgi:hypothetical protein